MTKEEIYTELKSIRGKLLKSIESNDKILIMFQVNNIDTLIYNLSLDLKAKQLSGK